MLFAVLCWRWEDEKYYVEIVDTNDLNRLK